MPTTIKAGAVTAFVTALKIIGEMKIDNKKQIPVVIAVRPVRPPTPTPELDSTKLVTVLVPIAAPNTVPIASARRALSAFSNSPSLFTKPIRLPIATNVPAVSKKSTNKKEKIATNALKGFENNSPKPFMNAPTASISKLVVKNVSGNVGMPSIWPKLPAMMPIIAVMTIPTNTAAGIFLITNAIVINSPKTANNTVGSARLPIPTNVDSLATMIPAFLSPTKAMKNPMPEPIASLS